MLKHLGIIMDGNRRWATERGLPPFMGHRQGSEVAVTIVRACIERGVQEVTLYAFSLENLARSLEEKSYLYNLIGEFAQQYAQDFVRENIRVCFLGNRSAFSSTVLSAAEQLEQATQQCTGLKLNILFCYGGQQEIIAMTRRVAQEVLAGTLSLDSIDKEAVIERLWANVSELDMVIRTGGAYRLSNFLSFQTAYSELFFTKTFWPAFTTEELDTLLAQFQQRKRNFGA